MTINACNFIPEACQKGTVELETSILINSSSLEDFLWEIFFFFFCYSYYRYWMILVYCFISGEWHHDLTQIKLHYKVSLLMHVGHLLWFPICVYFGICSIYFTVMLAIDRSRKQASNQNMKLIKIKADTYRKAFHEKIFYIFNR